MARSMPSISDGDTLPIRELMSPPEPKRQPIGFITPEEKKRG